MRSICIPGWLVLSALLSSCGGHGQIVSPTPAATFHQDPAPSAPPTPSLTLTPIAFPAMSATLPPTEIPYLPLPDTSTATSTTEPEWLLQGPGDVAVPVLLYHHIGFSLRNDTTYYVSPEAFDRQMNLLYQWGYRTISVELLARSIREGAGLPRRPVILTFDDGSETISSHALPVMQRYRFTGTVYIVRNYVGTPNYMDTEQIRQLGEAGWEIGSHSLSHVDLTARPDRQMDEIVQSRRQLEALLGLPVLSFAYPFGAHDADSIRYVRTAGYLAAMGLGNEWLQGEGNLFYLARQPVAGTDDLRSFAARLPWQEDVYDLPALTIVP